MKKVLFYKQTTRETCTAASLLMALKYFGKVPKLNKTMEMRLYKEIRYPNRYNVAIIARKYGLSPKIITNVKGIESAKWLTLIGESRSKMAYTRRQLLIASKKFKKLGIQEHIVKTVRLSDMIEILKNKGLVLVVVNAKLLGHEEVPHMIVIDKVYGKEFNMNDPLSDKPRIISLELFNKAKNFYGDQTLIGLLK